MQPERHSPSQAPVPLLGSYQVAGRILAPVATYPQLERVLSHAGRERHCLQRDLCLPEDSKRLALFS